MYLCILIVLVIGVCIYIYIYVFIYTYNYKHIAERRAAERPQLSAVDGIPDLHLGAGVISLSKIMLSYMLLSVILCLYIWRLLLILLS